MTTIVEVFAREILDSRGNPTVEVNVFLEGGSGDGWKSIKDISSTMIREAS